MSSLIIISLVVAVILIFAIILIVLLSKRKNKDKEVPASILDVQNIGVSTNNQEFSYGYEKEETVVMQPVDANVDTITNVEEKEPTNIQNTNVQDSKVLNVSTDDASKDLGTSIEDELANEYIENSDINDEVQDTSNDSDTSSIENQSIGEEEILK